MEAGFGNEKHSSNQQTAAPENPSWRKHQRGHHRWIIDELFRAITVCCFLVTFYNVVKLDVIRLPFSSLPTRTTTDVDFSFLSRHCAYVGPLSTFSFHNRQSLLTSALNTIDAAAYVAEPGANTQYYANISSSSWRLSERPLLLVFTRNNKIIVLSPTFELSRARGLLIPFAGSDIEYLGWAEDEDPYVVLAHRLASVMTKPQRIVLDDHMRLFVADGLRKAGLHDIGLEDNHDDDGEVSARDIVAQIREQKSPEEIEIMRCVNEVTLLAIRAVRPYLYFGMTESEGEELIRKALTDAGVANDGVFTTTQFGANAALPHGGGSDKTLGINDFVTFDVGGSLHGYWSDVTRTFALSESRIPTEHLEIWEVVKSAQEAALEEAYEGAVAAHVDRAARAVIRRAGFAEKFTHRLGHGIGLEVHETPYLRGGYERRLRKGNTFSDEPGIYIEGQVGVRLEDCFVVGANGQPELLTARVGGASRSPWVP